ncbi:hypothetical protein ACN9MB_13235 [Dyella kyungheensis]|uniref:hypothetical protein n=1 Tax=Dyella kyungheensis TaxID=1242174 RepID=UPI003CF98C77
MTPHDAVRALLEAGWVEVQVAEAVGTSQSTINRLKHGKVASVDYDTGSRLVQLVGKKPPKQIKPNRGGNAVAKAA